MSRRLLAVVQPEGDHSGQPRRRASANRGKRGSTQASKLIAKTATKAMNKALPPHLATELRRLLADALVRDYLLENKTVNGGHGDCPVRDDHPLPTPEGQEP
jgi:hypothetical protein